MKRLSSEARRFWGVLCNEGFGVSVVKRQVSSRGDSCAVFLLATGRIEPADSTSFPSSCQRQWIGALPFQVLHLRDRSQSPTMSFDLRQGLLPPRSRLGSKDQDRVGEVLRQDGVGYASAYEFLSGNPRSQRRWRPSLQKRTSLANCRLSKPTRCLFYRPSGDAIAAREDPYRWLQPRHSASLEQALNARRARAVSRI